jgi:hypothetical protein
MGDEFNDSPFANEQWFRRTMAVNLLMQAAAFIAALAFGNKWLAAVGGGIALLLGILISLPWQARLRKAHRIPDRFVD